MRIPLLCALLAVPAFAADFTLETESGEASRDASSSKATYVVKGDKVTLTTESSGRNFRPDGDEKQNAPKTAKITNPKEVAAALKDIRSTKDTKSPILKDTRYRIGCLVEGKSKLCATVTEGSTPRLDAIGKLEQLLLMEIMK